MDDVMGLFDIGTIGKTTTMTLPRELKTEIQQGE
jgi:hypothetical protein